MHFVRVVRVVSRNCLLKTCYKKSDFEEQKKLFFEDHVGQLSSSMKNVNFSISRWKIREKLHLDAIEKNEKGDSTRSVSIILPLQEEFLRSTLPRSMKIPWGRETRKWSNVPEVILYFFETQKKL